MYNKPVHRDNIIAVESIKQQLKQDSGLSYIHSPYPVDTSFLSTVFVHQIVVVVSSDHNTICLGCLFLPLDQFFVLKLRRLFPYVQYQIIIIEIAPKQQDCTVLVHNLLLRLRQLTLLFSVHCIMLDRSSKNVCEHWPIFSLVICWRSNLQKFTVHQ
jgi:hypothetical protein